PESRREAVAPRDRGRGGGHPEAPGAERERRALRGRPTLRRRRALASPSGAGPERLRAPRGGGDREKRGHPQRIPRRGETVPSGSRGISVAGAAAGRAADVVRAAQGSVRGDCHARRACPVRRIAEVGRTRGLQERRGVHPPEDGGSAAEEARLPGSAEQAAPRGGSGRDGRRPGGPGLVPGERSEGFGGDEGGSGDADQPGAARPRRHRTHLLRGGSALADEGSGVRRRCLSQGAGDRPAASRRRARVAPDRAAPQAAGEGRRGPFGPALREAEELMAKETVLVADADPRSLRLVEMALRRAGFAVVVAATGEEAMRALAGARPQAMMVDAALPAPDGIALCRAARGEERLAGVVILVLGTDAAPAAKAQAIEAGADDYLVKPIFLKEIVQRVQHLLERRRFSDPGLP